MMKGTFLGEKIDWTIRFFLYVLIFWLPYSSAVIEVCVIASLILWIIKRLITIKPGSTDLPGLVDAFKPASSPINGAIGLFLYACLISIASSVFIEQSWHNFLTKTLEWFIVYFLVLEVFTKKRHIDIALGIFLITAGSTVLDSLVQFYITHKDIFFGHILQQGARVTASFRTPNGLGSYLTILIPLLGAFCLSREVTKLRRVGCAVLLALSIWSVILTFSRGSWVGIGCGIIFLVVLQGKGNIRKFIAGFTILVILCSISVLAYQKFSGVKVLERNSQGWRMEVWQRSIQMIKDRPLVGHGINTYMNIFQQYRWSTQIEPTYAHNCYLQLAVETGVLGLAAFLYLLSCFFKELLRGIDCKTPRQEGRPILVGLVCGIMAFLVHSFFDTSFYSLKLSVYLWIMIGIAVASLKTQMPLAPELKEN